MVATLDNGPVTRNYDPYQDGQTTITPSPFGVVTITTTTASSGMTGGDLYSPWETRPTSTNIPSRWEPSVTVKGPERPHESVSTLRRKLLLIRLQRLSERTRRDTEAFSEAVRKVDGSRWPEPALMEAPQRVTATGFVRPRFKKRTCSGASRYRVMVN